MLSFYKKTSTDCLIARLKLCLYNNNLVFANESLLQTSKTATGPAPNSCSYANIATASLDPAIMEQKTYLSSFFILVGIVTMV